MLNETKIKATPKAKPEKERTILLYTTQIFSACPSTFN
jgi:hypothetical protein